MTDMGFHLKPQDRGRLVSLFRRVNGELVEEQQPESYEPQVFGDYGLLATADEYIGFLQMLLNMGQSGSTRLLMDHSVSEMTKNQIGSLIVEKQPAAIPDFSKPFPVGAGEDKFGLGVQLKEGMEGESRSRGSYSWAGLYNTHFWADPKRGLAAVLFMQVLPFYDDQCIRVLTDFEKRIYRNLTTLSPA
jgi:methyl acetate hydrolase